MAASGAPMKRWPHAATRRAVRPRPTSTHASGLRRKRHQAVNAPTPSLEQAPSGLREAKGEKLVPYSCRHGYAQRAHVICDLPPKVVAAAMGHSVQTHLAAYSRWCGDDVVDDAFTKAEQRLLAS